MSAAEADLAAHLDRQLDILFAGGDAQDGQGDPELTAVLRHVHTLATRPAPDAVFVRRLRADLGLGAPAQLQRVLNLGPTVPTRRNVVGARRAAPSAAPSQTTVHRSPAMNRAGFPWWPRLETAAVLLLIAVLVGYLAVADHGRRAENPPRFAGIDVPPVAMSSDPVKLRIEVIGVDATIERRAPGGEPLLIPAASDPWVVAWREDTPALGEGGNIVLEGHLDYWPGASAIFRDLDRLHEGDRIEVIGANRAVFSYAVEWLRRYPLADASEAQQQEILGPTDTPSVTLITAAGEYDRATGLFPEVVVVRARLDTVSSLPIMAVPDPAECRTEPRTIAELDAAADAVIARADAALESTDVIVYADTSGSSEVTAAVIAAERRLVACLNANDALRAYALFTDDGLVRLLNVASGATDPLSAFWEWDPDFSELALPATPVPASDRFVLLAVEDVSLLEDGRVMATVIISSRSPDMFGVPTGAPIAHVFARGDRYQIDEFIVPAPGTPAP